MDWIAGSSALLGVAALYAAIGNWRAQRAEMRLDEEIRKSASELADMLNEYASEEQQVRVREALGSEHELNRSLPLEVVEKVEQVEALSTEVTETSAPWYRKIGTLLPTAAAIVATAVTVVSWMSWTPVFPDEKECLEFTSSVRDTYVALDNDAEATARFYENAGLSSYRGECGLPTEMLPPNATPG